jgi:hypothetical protein
LHLAQIEECPVRLDGPDCSGQPGLNVSTFLIVVVCRRNY